MQKPKQYDRKGQPIELMKWACLAGDDDYKTVARTFMADVIVSTEWVGFDDSFGLDGGPLIFTTMVFTRVPNPQRDFTGHVREWDDDERGRWSTEAEALVGHERVVAELLAELATKTS